MTNHKNYNTKSVVQWKKPFFKNSRKDFLIFFPRYIIIRRGYQRWWNTYHQEITCQSFTIKGRIMWVILPVLWNPRIFQKRDRLRLRDRPYVFIFLGWPSIISPNNGIIFSLSLDLFRYLPFPPSRFAGIFKSSLQNASMIAFIMSLIFHRFEM